MLQAPRPAVRGCRFPIDALGAGEVADFRRKLEDYETEAGSPRSNGGSILAVGLALQRLQLRIAPGSEAIFVKFTCLSYSDDKLGKLECRPATSFTPGTSLR